MLCAHVCLWVEVLLWALWHSGGDGHQRTLCLSGSSDRAASVRNGHLPLSISYTTQPYDQKSTAKPYVCRRPSTRISISGAQSAHHRQGGGRL